MKADPQQQQLLLKLQAADNQEARLRHGASGRELDRRMHQLTDQLAALRRRMIEAQTEATDLQREIARSEEDVRRVRARLERDQDLADQGVSAKVHRDLQHELASLQRRLGDLEDGELEVMQRQEDLERLVADLREGEPRLAQELAAATAARTAAQQEAENELTEIAAQRTAITADLAPDLLRRYESVRADTPVAAAALTGSQCGGCRLELPPADVAELRAAPTDDLVECPECGCLLVRE